MFDLDGDGDNDVVFAVPLGRGRITGFELFVFFCLIPFFIFAGIFFVVILPDYFATKRSDVGKIEDNAHYEQYRLVIGNRPIRIEWGGNRCQAVFRGTAEDEFTATVLLADWDDLGAEGFLGGLRCTPAGETGFYTPEKSRENFERLSELQLLVKSFVYGKAMLYDPDNIETGFKGVLMSKRRDSEWEHPPWDLTAPRQGLRRYYPSFSFADLLYWFWYYLVGPVLWFGWVISMFMVVAHKNILRKQRVFNAWLSFFGLLFASGCLWWRSLGATAVWGYTSYAMVGVMVIQSVRGLAKAYGPLTAGEQSLIKRNERDQAIRDEGKKVEGPHILVRRVDELRARLEQARRAGDSNQELFVRRGEKVVGPINVLKLRKCLSGGQLRTEDMVSDAQEGPWLKIDDTCLVMPSSDSPFTS